MPALTGYKPSGASKENTWRGTPPVSGMVDTRRFAPRARATSTCSPPGATANTPDMVVSASGAASAGAVAIKSASAARTQRHIVRGRNISER